MKEEPAGFFQVFAIITTRANGLMAPTHDRMPVVLDTARLDAWMNAASTDLAPARSMLAPAPDHWLVAERVSPLVNNVRNDGPELLLWSTPVADRHGDYGRKQWIRTVYRKSNHLATVGSRSAR